MKTINTLIKYHQQQLDGLRREMVSLEGQKAQLLNVIEKLKAELKRELELAEKTPEMSYFFGDFATRIRKREDNIKAEVKKLDRQMDELRDKIREAFGELKKYEIVKDERIKAKKADDNRKETIMLDDVATTQYVRKHQDS